MTVSYCSAGSLCPAIVRRLKDSEARRPRATMDNGRFVQKLYIPIGVNLRIILIRYNSPQYLLLLGFPLFSPV